jgi:proteasome lid subunit RPN8/RPN11
VTPASPAPIVVSAGAERAIRRHAAADYPHECCGALLGSAERGIEEAVPFENASPGDQERRFLLSAGDYRRGAERARPPGRARRGVYHPAEPSAFDLAHAWPNVSYVIVSVRDGLPSDVRSWRLLPDRSQFAEEPLALAARG